MRPTGFGALLWEKFALLGILWIDVLYFLHQIFLSIAKPHKKVQVKILFRKKYITPNNEKKSIFFIFSIRFSNNITKRHTKFQVQIQIFRVMV